MANDIHRLIEDAVANAMQAQDSFVQNYQTLTQQGQDPSITMGHRNAKTGIAIYAELKGIRLAL